MENKASYQSILDFSNDLRKDVTLYFSEREFIVEGEKYTVGDALSKEVFSNLLFDYLNNVLSKDEFKREILMRVSWLHTPYAQNELKKYD